MSERRLGRRPLLQAMAAAAGGSLLAGASGVASADPDPPDERFSQAWWTAVQNETEDATVPTVFLADSEQGLDTLEGFGFEDFRRATGTDTPAAYAAVPTDSRSIGRLLRVESLSSVVYAPGANPFWVLEHYPDGVFPAVSGAVDYVSYAEFVQGVDHLASEFPDTVRHRRVGESPGWLDVRARDLVANDVHVVEVAEDVRDREAFAAREKTVASLGIHGDERAGVEASLRFLEDLARGDAPAADALDERALVLLFPNPDGWVARTPFTVDGRGGTTAVSPPANTFKRTNGTGHDPNRIYPTTGWIDPSHRPSEPRGRDLTDDGEGVDADVPEEPYDYEREVSDGLAVVEALRDYDAVEWFADFHGMFGSEQLVKLLTMNSPVSFADANVTFQFARDLEADLADAVGDRLGGEDDPFTAAAEEMASYYGLGRTPETPSEPFAAGSVFDMVGYNTTGGLGSWAARPVEDGGLGARGLAFEMAFDNRVGDGVTFRPGSVAVQVDAYRTVLDALLTGTTAGDATVDADQRESVAVVAGESGRADAADLPFPTVGADGDSGEPAATGEHDGTPGFETTERPLSLSIGKRREVPVTVGPDDRRVSATVDAADGAVDVDLFDPDGTLVRTVERDTLATRPGQRITLGVTEPAPGEWTVAVSNRHGAREASLSVTTRVTGPGAHDPRDALGYRQRDYDVSVGDVAEAYGAALGDTGTVERRAPGSVPSADSDGVEALVLTTDAGTDRNDYFSAVKSLLAGGGRVVLTDRGLRLLGEDLFPTAVGADDVQRTTRRGLTLGERQEGHPLLAGTRAGQRELARAGCLGYASSAGGAPVFGVDRAAFEDADGTVAATLSTPGAQLVTAGTIPHEDGEISVVGSLLPAPTQRNLHPFGLEGHAPTHLGYAVLANALGHSVPSVVAPGDDGDGGD